MSLPASAGARAVRVAAALALSLATGCGGTPATLQAPAAPSVPAAVAAPPAPDIGAVPDPPSLVLSGRVARPSAVLAVARAWSRLPVPQSEELTELVVGNAVGPLADIDEPLDFAIAVVGSGARTRARAAVSVALKDAERAKATLADRYKLANAENGAILVQGLGRHRHGDGEDDDEDRGEEERRACEIAPAYGAAAWRLVCGWGPRALADLAPWLTRTATRASIPADARLDLRLSPVRATLAAEKRLLGGILATAAASHLELPSARELATSVTGDLLDFALDLEAASLDLHIADPGAAATADLKFSGATSSLSRLAAANPDRNGPPPDAFLGLPADADFALFERGIDEHELGRARDLLLHVLGDGLAEYGLKEPDRKPILDAFAKMTTSSPLVYASGLDVDAAAKAIAAARVARDGTDAAAIAEADRGEAEALLGWRLVEAEEPAARWIDGLKDLSAAVSKPAFGAAYRSRVPKGAPPVFRPAPLPKAPALPQGTAHYVLEVYPVDSALFAGPASAAASPGGAAAPGGPGAAGKARPASATRKPVAFDVFVAPAAGRTWIGMGGGDVLVASKIAAALAPAGDKVGARPELAALKPGPVGAGGFFTARALPEGAPQLEALLGTPHVPAALFEDIGKLPSRGTTPIVFAVTAQGGGGAGAPAPGPASVTVSLDVPRAAIEDIVAAILRHGAF